jgi:hypothetical protein
MVARPWSGHGRYLITMIGPLVLTARSTCSGRVKYQLVLTKCDMVKVDSLARVLYLTEQVRVQPKVSRTPCCSCWPSLALKFIFNTIFRLRRAGG